jgi:glutamate N-acetyltransferase/amino-acid N-acetyltransferase
VIAAEPGFGGDEQAPQPLPALPSALPDVDESGTLPRGFRVAATTAGIKASGLRDLSLVVVDGEPASVAATFTTNRLPAAAVRMDMLHLAATSEDASDHYGWVSALMATSGCANAATGDAGMVDQLSLAATLAELAGTDVDHVLAMSTGLIGTRLPVDSVARAMRATMNRGLRVDDGAWLDVADALRTTDSRAKVASVRLELPRADGTPVEVTISGVAKGVGMIHPNMATMLCFALTDATVEPATLHALLRPIVARTWDQISVDGDQSTNDTVLLVASGAAAAAPLEGGRDGTDRFERALEAVARSLARQQAADGEGATTLINCAVSGAADDADARAVARGVVASSLVKAAVHGADPNWGRIAAAVGNAVVAPAEVLRASGMSADDASARAGRGVRLDPALLRIDVCGTPVFAGTPVEFDVAAVSARMHADEVRFRIDLGIGDGSGEAFGCDLTEAYVIENSEYST